ncbi:hypothetical protein BC829DRAFT_488865 [Chytridium lagenaria]|nr:hypothetical protein BC829DRAFT_488865 [Chytridium lagenaria]
MRFRQSQGDPVGYVLWSAPNNIFSQMLGLYMAVFVSTALNRTLIIPSSGFSISEQDCGEEMNPEELSIDLLALQNMTGLRSITDAAFSKNRRATGQVNLVELTGYEKISVASKYLYFGCITSKSQVIFTDHRKALGQALRKSFRITYTGLQNAAEKISVRLGGAKSYWSIHLSDQDLSSTERIKKAVDWTISHIVSNAHGFNQTSHARKTMSHRERLFWCKEGSTNNHSGSNADGYEKGPIIFLSMAKALVTIPKRLEDAFPCLFTLRQLGDDISRKESQKEEDATDSRREQTSKHGVSGEEGGEMSRYDEQLLELLVALSSAKVIGKPQDAFLRLAKELK